MIGAARLSPGSNWRRNQTRVNPPWIGGTCDIAPATVGPDLQHKSRLALALVPPVSAWRQRPTSSDLISRNLGVIGLTLSCWSRPLGLAFHGASSPAGSPRMSALSASYRGAGSRGSRAWLASTVVVEFRVN